MVVLSVISSLRPINLVTRIQLQVQLHAITNTIIGQCQEILKGPLALPLQHNLMRLATDAHGDQFLEIAYAV